VSLAAAWTVTVPDPAVATATVTSARLAARREIGALAEFAELCRFARRGDVEDGHLVVVPGGHEQCPVRLGRRAHTAVTGHGEHLDARGGVEPARRRSARTVAMRVSSALASTRVTV
jgi:hypothetical protein